MRNKGQHLCDHQFRLHGGSLVSGPLLRPLNACVQTRYRRSKQHFSLCKMDRSQ